MSIAQAQSATEQAFLSVLVTIPTGEIATDVTQILAPSEDLPDTWIVALARLWSQTANAAAGFIQFLVEHGYHASDAQVRQILSGQRAQTLLKLWSDLLRSPEPLARTALVEILCLLPQFSVDAPPLLEWLNGDTWTRADADLLDRAFTQRRETFRYRLSLTRGQEPIGITRVEEARQRSGEAPVETTRAVHMSGGLQEGSAVAPSAPGALMPRGLGYLVEVICVVIGLGTFVAVPFDLAASIGSSERLGARIVNGSMFGIGTLGVALALSAATMAGGATRSGCRLRPASAGSGALDSTRTSQRASASRCRCLNSLRCLASLP